MTRKMDNHSPGTIHERRCATCRHPQRNAIDKSLAEGKQSYQKIAGAYGLKPSSVYNHAKQHLSAVLREAAVEQAISDAKAILRRADRRALRLNEKSEEDGKINIAVVREAREHDALLLKATGNWRESSDITIRPGEALTPAEQSDQDWLYFIDSEEAKQFVGLQEVYAKFQERRLLAELEARPAEESPLEERALPRLLKKVEGPKVGLGDPDACMGEEL